MSRLVFLPILLISGVNVTSGLPSNIADIGCQCRVWYSFQYCRSRVSMSRLAFLPILSISGVNVASGLPSNIVDLGCQCRVCIVTRICRATYRQQLAPFVTGNIIPNKGLLAQHIRVGHYIIFGDEITET